MNLFLATLIKSFTAKRRQSLAERFVAAAELIEDDVFSYCCPAIHRASNGHSDQIVKLFNRFKPDFAILPYDPWFGEPDVPANKQTRILALLLAAAMAEDGET